MMSGILGGGGESSMRRERWMSHNEHRRREEKPLLRKRGLSNMYKKVGLLMHLQGDFIW